MFGIEITLIMLTLPFTINLILHSFIDYNEDNKIFIFIKNNNVTFYNLLCYHK